MRHAPVPIRGFLHISGLPLTFVGIALFSAKKGHGFFISSSSISCGRFTTLTTSRRVPMASFYDCPAPQH
jgi:hypothetical protein